MRVFRLLTFVGVLLAAAVTGCNAPEPENPAVPQPENAVERGNRNPRQGGGPLEDPWMTPEPCAAFSPDGKWFLVYLHSRLVFWDLTTRKALDLLSPHVRDERVPGMEQPFRRHMTIEGMAFSPDSKLALTGGGDNLLRLWEFPSGKEVRSFHGHQHAITAVAYAPDGKHLLSGDKEGTIKVWDADNGKCLQTWANAPFPVLSMTFSLDSKRALFLVKEQQTFTVWEVPSGKAVQTFVDASMVTAAALAPNGKQVLSANAQGSLKLWDVANGKVVQEIQTNPGIQRLALLSDGKRALTGPGRGEAHLWDLTTGRILLTYSGEPHGRITHLAAVSPNGRQALFVTPETWMIADVESGDDVVTLIAPSHPERYPVVAVRFLPDGTQALSAAGSRISLWRVTDGKVLRTFDNHGWQVDQMALSPDGKLVLSNAGSKVKLWEVATGRLLHTLEENWGGLIAFSADGRWAYTSRLKEDPRIHTDLWNFDLNVWDVTTGKLIRTHGIKQPLMQGPWWEAISSDGQRLFLADQKMTKMWDPATGKMLKAWSNGNGPSRILSPDGKLCLRYLNPADGKSPGEDRFVEVDTGKRLARLARSPQDPFPITAWAFSSDSKSLLIETEISWGWYLAVSLTLWDVANGKLIREFKGRGFRWHVRSLAFSPDGQLAVAGEDAGIVRLWDVARGKELRRFVIGEKVRRLDNRD
jgi:WD40 repeat protein